MRNYAIDKDIKISSHLNYDVVIVGAGVAGLYAALNLGKGIRCAILNKSGLDDSNSIYAQGGIASVTLDIDSFKSHYDDTMVAGAKTCDPNAVKVLITEGPNDIKNLITLGVPFDRDNDDKISITKEGAHSYNRIIHCGGDATGYHLTKTLINVAMGRDNIEILNNYTLYDIVTNDKGEVAGVIAQDNQGNNLAINTSNVIIASGGIGRLYRNSTNSSSSTGDGIAAAIRAGAEVDNMEFVQFHPTALIHPDLNMRYFLISEALRGEGAILLNRRGERFMESYHPLAELAPRDIVSRSIISEMKKYDLPNVYLNISFMSREFLKKRFPQIYEACMRRGIDIAVNWIPVVPVQHYFMGGIKTDIDGKTNIKGLYACGESACTGVHGANRLASNSLLECLVFGRRAAIDINNKGKVDIKKLTIPHIESKEKNEYDYETYRTQIKNIMTRKGGILRNAIELEEAIYDIGEYYNNLNKVVLNSPREIEALNMSTVALEVLKAALERKTSIGAHYRTDTQENMNL